MVAMLDLQPLALLILKGGRRASSRVGPSECPSANWHARLPSTPAISSVWYRTAGRSTIIFVILILTLVFRPEGLLGERTPEGG